MITEDQLEQLVLTWSQETCREYPPGPTFAPDGAAPERSDYRAIVPREPPVASLRDALLAKLGHGKLPLVGADRITSRAI